MEDNSEDACKRDLNSTGLRSGEETDRAMWKRKIFSHTGDCARWKKPGEKKKEISYIISKSH